MVARNDRFAVVVVRNDFQSCEGRKIKFRAVERARLQKGHHPCKPPKPALQVYFANHIALPISVQSSSALKFKFNTVPKTRQPRNINNIILHSLNIHDTGIHAPKTTHAKLGRLTNSFFQGVCNHCTFARHGVVSSTSHPLSLVHDYSYCHQA